MKCDILHLIKGSWIQGKIHIKKKEIQDQTDPSKKMRYYYCSSERNPRYGRVRSRSKQLFPEMHYRYRMWITECSRRKSCLKPPRMSCSMRRMSVRGTAALRRNSMRTVSRKPVLGVATRRHCLYRASTCSCSLLCRPADIQCSRILPLSNGLDHFRTLKEKK